MAFEDDMIEAGYSDEQEYFDRLIDDYEENYNRQLARETKYNDDEFLDFNEDEERELLEEWLKKKKENQWVANWKKNNSMLVIIWHAQFRNSCNWAQLSNYRINEYDELKKWLKEREFFDNERKKENWLTNFNKLFTLYKDELFKFYFPEDEEQTNIDLISQQAHELHFITLHEPLLWETVCSSYDIDDKLFEEIEWWAFYSEVCRRAIDYDFWKDSNIEQYNQFAKKWIADSDLYVYGDWLKLHETEEIGWKKEKHELWEKYKRNFEIRESNKFIESKIEEYFNKFDKFEKDYFNDEDDWDTDFKEFLPDLECKTEIPFDVSTLNHEISQFIKDSIYSVDMSKISIEASRYADKVLKQLWIYNHRDDWEMDALKKHHKDLFKYEDQYSQEFLIWWREKYPTEWDNFINTVVPAFKNNFITVTKFRLWALDNHKEEFVALADKHLPYWKKTLMLIYGQDIHEQLCHYFYEEIGHGTDFWGEDVDYIKKHASTKEVEIWQKELKDKVIWDVIYKKNYREHYYIEAMYTSLNSNS